MAKDKKTEKNGSDQVEEKPSGENLPRFYKSVAVLNRKEHDGLCLKPLDDFSFANDVSSILVVATEFAQAAAHYPIVFWKSPDGIVALAVTGHKEGENAFVDSDNSWRKDTYVPAYVRRYPFLLVQSDDGKTLSLAVDDKSQFISDKEGEKLYSEDGPSDTSKHALQFCLNFRAELERTKTLMNQLDDADILVERNAAVTLSDGEVSRIAGFSVVDEKKLSELDDHKFLQMRKTGLLNMIYAHMWSMRVWNNLLDI
ncbi:MAG: SapC family protein [Pseudomonadota bacterium]